jgi:hypothetical protein
VSLIGLVVALALLAYFIWKARQKRIFLLGLPFLMYMGESVYFDKVKVFWIPQRLGESTAIMVWLFVVWVLSMDLLLPRGVATRARRLFGPPLRLPEELLLAVLGAAVLVNVFVSGFRYGNFPSVLWAASGWFYLFVGYLLLRGIVAMADPGDVIEFLDALVVVNAGAAVLYIASQGLHLPVYAMYAGSVSGVVEYHGVVLLRAFAYYPQMLLLTLAVLLARPRWNWSAPLILAVNLVAIWVSYTRSWFLIAAFLLGVVLFVRLIKARQMQLAVRRLGAIVMLVVVAGSAVFLLLPTESSYFLSRVSSADGSGGIASDSSFLARKSFIVATYDHIAQINPLLGVGFPPPGQDSLQPQVARWSADTLWVPVVYSLGEVGVVLFVAVFVAYSARALLASLRFSGDEEYLGLVSLGLIAGTIIGTFVSWSVVDPNRFPLGLWPFAFLAALPLMPAVGQHDGERRTK